jgi:hypothetical protein
MAENVPSVSPLDGHPLPGAPIVTAAPKSITVTIVGDVGAIHGGRANSPLTIARVASSPAPTCPGTVSWLSVRAREVHECVLPCGHRGDHRDAAGYPWNDERWLE